jgi:hypothetical protein
MPEEVPIGGFGNEIVDLGPDFRENGEPKLGVLQDDGFEIVVSPVRVDRSGCHSSPQQSLVPPGRISASRSDPFRAIGSQIQTEVNTKSHGGTPLLPDG